MRYFSRYLRQRKKVFLAFLLFSIIFGFTFYLYHFPLDAILYPALLCIVLGLLMLGIDCFISLKKHQLLTKLQHLPDNLQSSLPSPTSLDDYDYQSLIQALLNKNLHLENTMNRRYAEMIDYYTVWAHQIKTPISSMHLTLQSEDSVLSRKLSGDLSRIEQYVEMVLAFLRLDSEYTDFVIQEYDLDTIVRQTIRKFASKYITRKIKLIYTPLNAKIITDEKWLSFVLEQILSNALKYTRDGSIHIYQTKPAVLCIEDTGIGIAAEDLPRIFEKGYTGFNGRSDKRASGLGLYLCKRICQSLGHEITASSIVGKGTVIRLDLEHYKLEAE